MNHTYGLEPILVRERVAQRINRRTWLHEYRCVSCGQLKISTRDNAKQWPKCISCRNKTHGRKSDPRYSIWVSMKQRCTNPNSAQARNYVLRGISVCREWMTFDGFMRWEGFDQWRPGLQIDRIDVNGNYEPSNCRWATPRENCRNKRSTRITAQDANAIRFLRANGMSNRDISEAFGVSPLVVSQIVCGRSWVDDNGDAE